MLGTPEVFCGSPYFALHFICQSYYAIHIGQCKKKTLCYFNAVTLVVVTMYVASLLSQRLVINLLENTAFDVKVDFYGGRKNGEPRDKPSESD